MGKRYTEEEKRQIQELGAHGYTDESIAQRLGRSTKAIRNIRHRNNIKTQTTQTIQQLREKKQILKQQTNQIEYELRKLEQRRNQTQQALQIEETQFNKKLATELTKLKDSKPELFTITVGEQIIKPTAELGVTFVRWLIE